MSNLPVPVVVPARYAAHWPGQCLDPVGRRHPRKVMVVDGYPTDNTVRIKRSFGVRVMSDEGGGLPLLVPAAGTVPMLAGPLLPAAAAAVAAAAGATARRSALAASPASGPSPSRRLP